jgi:hypothetical protein
MNTVLVQECIRYNKLLGAIKRDLAAVGAVGVIAFGAAKFPVSAGGSLPVPTIAFRRSAQRIFGASQVFFVHEHRTSCTCSTATSTPWAARWWPTTWCSSCGGLRSSAGELLRRHLRNHA